ncbi:MAG: hypothetical protein IJ524_05375 [Bacteroidales bacterium]|nr:hypothetical protein [Bacteroidales bacterium]
MKHLLRLSVMLAAVLTLSSCHKCPPEGDHVVAYTVDKGPEHRVYLVDDKEWQTMLDRFCDWAEGGSTVTFYNANKSPNGHATKDATTFSTTSREEMKRWMARMEDEGLTVTVSYDSATGTWNGTAYATAPQPQQGDCYTGTLVYVQRDYHSDYPQYSYWGLRVSEDSVFRLAKGGVYLTTNNPLIIDGTTYRAGESMGETVTLCGALNLQWDAYSDYFVLDLDNNYRPYGTPPMPVYVGEKDGYKFLMTLDTTNHRMYCTSTLGDFAWQGAIGGGMFDYLETDMADIHGNAIIEVFHPCASEGHPFSLERTNNTTIVLHDYGNYTTDQYLHTLDGITLHRTYGCWETWGCDTMGFNIVIHLNTEGDAHYSIGYSSMPFYVDCPTPFEAGEFYPDRFNNGWGTMTYTATGRTVNMTADFIDDNTVRLTPQDETVGCVGSYVFHRK